MGLMADVKITEEQKDDLAGVVLERYRRAKQYREDYVVHQRKTAQSLIDRAEKQYRREYTTADAAEMNNAFGFEPTRYMGIVQQKVNATVAWNNDLIVNNLDAMFTVNPSPNPELDNASLERIRRGVRAELRQRMRDAGIADPRVLITGAGETDERVDDFLREQVMALKTVEQSRIVGLASSQAKLAQTAMRDTMVDGGFRQAYAAYSFDRALYGIGIMRFPDWQRKPKLVHARGGKAKLEFVTAPWFRHVKVHDFYPICDAIDYQTNTGNTERTYVTKAELISMGAQDEFFSAEITKILEEFAYHTRNWLDTDDQDRDAGWWGLDETIPLLIHEGFFSGDELREYGIDGIGTLDYVSARIEVCGARTIKCRLLKMPGGADRSYFGAPFTKIGSNLYDYLGMGAMLWDSEQRANRLMHLFEHNVDWASRPPLLTNPGVFENPNDARNIVPGGNYKIEDRWATSGSMPEPVRPMGTVSAQYHLIMTQLGAILRQADEDCGIPAFAYGAQDFGRSSLGEYSQRMTNALRTIKQSALNEDMYFIEPAFTGLFNYKMTTEKDFAAGQDVGVLVRGMTGLLKEDERIQREQAVLPLLLSPAVAGIVPEQAVRYAVRNLLQQAGFPVEALGMSDPEIDRALAVAAGQPTPGTTPGGPQVPALDGRSGAAAMANSASPSGASPISIPGPTV
jgi:hypothetical protein